jgi:hypothetical protein
MWSRHPGFTNTKIRDCLTGTAVKLGPGSFDNTWGHGRVDAERAVRCGDIVFTHFTQFTRLTRFTPFTRLTPFTPFTSLTRFTFFTRFTPFTPLTPFTRFTRFTPFDPFSRFPDPGPEPLPEVGRFVRVGNMVFEPDELAIGRFPELASAAVALGQAGILGIDQLAVARPADVATALGVDPVSADALVRTGQALVRRLGE